MDLFDVLSMIGGLALFLYGMHLMGDGLSKASGGKMEIILEKLTSKPFMAVLMGAVVTAVIQSSSATTVMVVGFVNSGIMKLTQAVSIIMGANIGTTITSWILSLTGIESGNFFIQLLKPTSFSPVLAVIGVIFLMFSKKEKKNNIGMIFIGFAILMFGMDTMSAAVKPLADVPEFTNILLMFSNPILGMIAGAVLTAIIQSSSASVGILQALCATGAVPFATALPIIMGQNIGTCVTAILSSIGASKNAKRTALVHLYFNLIGTIVFMAVFYAVNSFVNFAFLDNSANPAGIALIHSIFNVTATVVLLPFRNLLVKLACMTIKDKEEQKTLTDEENELSLLESRFLDTPSLALEQSRNVTVKMAKMSLESLQLAIGLFTDYKEEESERVSYLEGMVDRYEDELGTYLVKLSSKNLSEKDGHTLNIILHCIGDFERISDHALNLKFAAKEMYDKDVSFSENAIKELEVLKQAVLDIAKTTAEVFEKEDCEQAIMVEPMEEVIHHLTVEMKNRHVNRLREGSCTIELGFILSDIMTNCERVSDHCSNIAVCIIQVHEDALGAHEYLEAMKSGDNIEFRGRYLAVQEKYLLP